MNERAVFWIEGGEGKTPSDPITTRALHYRTNMMRRREKMMGKLCNTNTHVELRIEAHNEKSRVCS